MVALCVLTCCSCCWCESKRLPNSWHSQVHWLLWSALVSSPSFLPGGGGVRIRAQTPVPFTALVAQKSDWGSRREGSTSQLGLQNSPNITRSICYLFFYSGWKGISCHGILQPGILLPGFLIKLGIWGMFLKCCNPSQHSLSVLALDLQSFFSYQNTKEHAISQ